MLRRKKMETSAGAAMAPQPLAATAVIAGCPSMDLPNTDGRAPAK